MIHEVEPDPMEDGALSERVDLSRVSNVCVWPSQPAYRVEGSGEESDRATVLYRLAMVAMALAASQIVIRNGPERTVVCLSCGEKTPTGFVPRHGPRCFTAEVVRLIDRLKELEGLKSQGEEEANSEERRSAGDGNRPRSGIREPWQCIAGPKPGWFQLVDRDGCRRAIVGGRFVDRRQTAERIASCVNKRAEESAQ